MKANRLIVAMAMLVSLMGTTLAIAMVTDMNGTVVYTNNDSENTTHIMTATHVRVEVTNDSAEANTSANIKMPKTTVKANATNREQIRKERPVVTNSLVRDKCSQILRNATMQIRAEEKNKVTVGKNMDEIRANVILAGMNATINMGYKYNANVSTLVNLKDKFIEYISQLKNVNSSNEHRKIAREMERLILQFRKEAHNIPELEQHAEDVRAAVANTMKQEKEKYNEKMREEYNKAKIIGLAVFDLHVCKAQEKIDRMAELGVNITNAQEKLNEISAMRDELEAAYDSGNRTEVAKIKVEIAHKWREFYQSFMRANAEMVRKRFEIAKEKMVKAIQRMKSMKRDTSQIENQLNELDRRANKIKNPEEIKQFISDYNRLNKRIIASVRVGGRVKAQAATNRAEVSARGSASVR